MAEIIMTFALGFLIAGGIALALMPAVWRRASNVTRKRLNAASPVNLDDFNADKDRMRAEFAMSARKLEMSVENLRKKAETRLAELDKREREVADLRSKVEEKAGVADTLGEEIALFRQRLTTAETNLLRREKEITELKERLADAQTVLKRQAIAIREANSMVEGHRDEIEVLTSDIDAKADEIARKAAAIEERDVQLAKCGRAVAEQKMQVGELRHEIAQQREVVAQLTDERDAAVAVSAAAARRETELIGERDRAQGALEAAQQQIAALQEQAALTNAENASRIETDQRETALLRQRLGDLAHEVDRASGDIDALLGSPGPAAVPHGPERRWSTSANVRLRGTEPAETGVARPISLAERIRALSRVGVN